MIRPSLASIAGILLFVVIPAVLGVAAADRAFRFLGEMEAREARLDLAQEARNILAFATPEEVILARFQSERKDFASPDESSAVSDPQGDQRPACAPGEAGFSSGSGTSLWPEGSAWVRNGRPLAPDGLFHPPLASGAQEALERLAVVLDAGSDPEPEDIRLWEHAFGVSFDPRAFRSQPGYPYPVIWGRNSAWLLWERKASAPVDLILAIPPDPGWRLKEAFRSWASVSRQGLRAAVVFPGTRRFIGTKTWESGRVGSLIRGFRRGQSPEQPVEAKITLVERLAGHGWLVMEKDLLHVRGWETSRVRSVGVPFLILGGILLFFPLQRSIQGSPLAVRLLGMFGYVIVLPLVGVGVLTFGVLADGASLRRGEVIQRARSMLMEFDDEFRRETARTERTCRRLTRLAFKSRRTPEDRESFRRVAVRVLERKLVDRLEIRDWKKEVWLHLEDGFSDDGMNRLFSSLSEYVIVEFGSRVSGGGGEPTRKSPLLMVMQELFEHPYMAFHEHLRKPGRLVPFEAGNTILFWFWDLGNDRSRPAAFVNIMRSRESAVETYIQRNLIRNREFRIVAFDGQTGQWFGLRRPGRTMKALTAAVIRGGGEQTSSLSIAGTPFLALGYGSRKMGNLVLVAMIPEAAWEFQGKPLRNRVGWGILIAILVGVSATWLLANGLLLPISDLSDGIEAMRRRERDYEIPVRAPDELGRVAGAFNRMLENVHEFDVAKDIQDTIMPMTWPQIPGYRFDLRIRRSAGVGGDYGEVLAFPDGRFGILLGDVSGTGTSGALVVAMVKAAVTLFLEERGKPEEFLGELNRMVQEVARPNRFSCAFLLLTPGEGRVEVSLAGNPFPVWGRPSAGFLKRVGKPNYPLGTRRNLQLSPQSIVLQPGDFLFSFSDGLAQAHDGGSARFGYDRVEQILSGASRESPEAMLERVERELESFRGSTPLPDDVSLCALSRDSGRKA